MEGLPNRPFQPSLKCQLCLRTPVSDLSGLNIKPGDDSECVARACSPNLVIASAAKQSRIFPWWDSGLLRCARNDGVAAVRLPAGQSRIDRGPEAAMFRRAHWCAGMSFEQMGFEQEDRDGEDDQGGGEQDEAVAHGIAFNRHRGRMMASSRAETITARDP